MAYFGASAAALPKASILHLRTIARVVTGVVLATAATRNAQAENDRPDLPRLTGVIVGPDFREAMFAAADGAAVMVVNEGERIGAFRVRRVQPGQVELIGPRGSYYVTLAPDDSLRTRFLVPPRIMALIDPVRREHETENDQ